MAEEFIPKWIAWETTQKCNLKCVHCRCSSDMLSSEGDFTTEEGKKLLKEIADFSKPVVVLSGGEPLLRNDIFELAEYGTSLGLRMCMATNGALVTDEVCEKMKKADIKMVSLSLDGSTAEVHDDFRSCPGAFQGVVDAAELLPQARAEVPHQLLLHQAKPARHRQHLQGRQVAGRHRLVHVHDRPHRPRRGDHERADLQGGLRGDPRVALPAGKAGGRHPHAPHLRPPLLPDRAPEGQGRGGEVRAPVASPSPPAAARGASRPRPSASSTASATSSPAPTSTAPPAT